MFNVDGPGMKTLQAAMNGRTPLLVALPRSTLHLKLLLDNPQALDICLIRDDHMLAPAIAAFGDRVVHLGREATIGRGRLNLLSLRAANARYYAGVGILIDKIAFEKLIIFLSTEPLEEFILQRIPHDKVEIWEEGLMHYVDLEGAIFRIRRRMAQWLCGFHVRRLSGSIIDKNAFRVRDRFREGSLRFSRPRREARYRDEILFIGQPLVRDGIVSRKVYAKGLSTLIKAVPAQVRYLPHPRERAEDVRALADCIGASAMTIETDQRGVIEHGADWSYMAYLSPFSTALLDLGEVDRSFWVAGLVGLGRHGRRLRSLKAFPVITPDSVDELISRLSALSARPHPSEAAQATQS